MSPVNNLIQRNFFLVKLIFIVRGNMEQLTKVILFPSKHITCNWLKVSKFVEKNLKLYLRLQ